MSIVHHKNIIHLQFSVKLFFADLSILVKSTITEILKISSDFFMSLHYLEVFLFYPFNHLQLQVPY